MTATGELVPTGGGPLNARLICIDASQIEGKLPGDGQILLTAGSEHILGRGLGCTYPIASRKLSRQHARIHATARGWVIEDLQSTNGIQVNRQRVAEAVLRDGDEVRIGPIPFKFELDLDALPDAAPAPRAEDVDGERTMIFGTPGAGASAPADATPSPRVDVTQPRAGRPKLGMYVAIAAAVLLVGGLVIYFTLPTGGSAGDPKLAALVARADAVIDHVVKEGGTSLTGPVEQLDPLIVEAKRILDQDPRNPAAARLYAVGRLMVFERVFATLFGGNRVQEASRQAEELRIQLAALMATIGDLGPAEDRAEIKTAVDLALLARIAADLRQAASKPEAAPDPDLQMQYTRLLKDHAAALHARYRVLGRTLQEFERKWSKAIGR